MFLAMAGLRVAKFHLGTGAFSCPVTLVTSSKPSSSLSHLATSNEEASNTNALRSGTAHGTLCVLVLPLGLTFLLLDPSEEHSSGEPFFRTKGYLPI